MRLRVLVYNVRGFRDGIGSVAGVVRRLAPDVILLNESGARWRLRRFARAVEMRAAGDPWSPFRRRVKDAILVRPPWRLVEPRLHRFAGSIRWYPRGMLLAEADRLGARVSLAVTHLGLRPSERRRHAGELLICLRSVPVPLVIGGDLNELPGRGVANDFGVVYADAWLTAGDGEGSTFPAHAPTARIDYLFASKDVEVRRAIVPTDPDVRAASDHRPLVVDLGLRSVAEAEGPA